MSQVEIEGADLRALVERARGGEDVVLVEDGREIAKIVAAPSKQVIRLGLARGKYKAPDDFDASLPDDLLDLFYYGPIFPDDPPVAEAKRLAEERLKSGR